ncbi:aminotransferase class III-fold pyridoxal phosphate-dependent enzyme [Streptomyces sp. 4F14]|uniref:aminotransferase class III-fold pyridoxal phosphate-dependent enzyme n=1 Tax=Streptomyces sp. 4F14 TaxID=3394380 RepID=UPI003A851BEE
MVAVGPGGDVPGVPFLGEGRQAAVGEVGAGERTCALPIVPVRARGPIVEGADGRRYLDCLSGGGALALGHNHPVVLEAVRGVLDSGAPLHAPGLATSVQDAFVAELLCTLPPGLAGHARVRFGGPAGTDAVATTLAPARTAVLAFTDAHHTIAAGVPDTRTPPVHRCPYGAGDGLGAELAVGWAESVLGGREPGVPRPDCVILEPVQDSGVPAPDGWLRRMRRITAERAVPLIADETRTGVGRTGAFWAVGHSGISPDAMVLSRAIGGGLPLAVIVHRDDLDLWGPGGHAGTVPGNQLAMAAGAATLAHVRENRLADHAARVGARMLRQLRSLAGEFPWIGDVHGRGLMIGVDMAAGEPGPTVPLPVRSGVDRRAPCPTADAVRRACLERGLIVGLGGRDRSVVRLLPPLTITDDQATAILDRFADALAAVTRDPRTHRSPSDEHPHRLTDPPPRATPPT